MELRATRELLTLCLGDDLRVARGTLARVIDELHRAPDNLILTLSIPTAKHSATATLDFLSVVFATLAAAGLPTRDLRVRWDGSVPHSPLAMMTPNDCGESLVVYSSQEPPLPTFPFVAVGGTFDRLHAGHRLLLTVAATITTEKLWVGLTGDALLGRKSLRNLIQPWEKRRAVLEDYVSSSGARSLEVQTVELSDPAGPAATEADIQALVVSEETRRGATFVNQARIQNKLLPLHVVVVDLIVGEGDKLSSTALRRRVERPQEAGPS